MSKFRKNTPLINPDEHAKSFIEAAEDGNINKVEKKMAGASYAKKEFTFPLSAKHAGLLEKIFNFYDGDISRRKLGAKALALGIETEAERLGISIDQSEYEI